jgi:hypothetical protein
MAKAIDKIEDDVHTDTPEVKKDKSVDPILQIALEMARVSKGKTVADLRDLVRNLYPKTRDEAVEFQKLLNRLTLASEAVKGYGTEQYAIVFGG